jgi:hypothetical protein
MVPLTSFLSTASPSRPLHLIAERNNLEVARAEIKTKQPIVYLSLKVVNDSPLFEELVGVELQRGFPVFSQEFLPDARMSN